MPTLSCPNCNRTREVREFHSGLTIVCPGCQARIFVDPAKLKNTDAEPAPAHRDSEPPAQIAIPSAMVARGEGSHQSDAVLPPLAKPKSPEPPSPLPPTAPTPPSTGAPFDSYPDPGNERIRWRWYIGGGAVVLCLVAVWAFAFGWVGNIFRSANKDVVSGPNADPKLDVRQFGKVGQFLRVVLPKETKADDKLVLVYVDPKATETPEEVILMPEGNIEAMIKDALRQRREFGMKGTEVFQLVDCRFNNGTYDVVATENSRNKVGVYAVAKVHIKGVGRTSGTSCTYFNISAWTTEKAGEVEIPLPSSTDQKYIPRICELFVFLIGKDGERRVQGTVKVERK